MHTELQVPNVTELHEITAELTRLSGTLPTQVHPNPDPDPDPDPDPNPNPNPSH